MVMLTVFSSHNVILPDGTQTAPHRPLVSEAGACQAALAYLAAGFGPDKLTIADVGCLEGGYAAEFAQRGYDVTGIEAREENYQRALQLQSAFAFPNLRFICGDVWDVLPGMSFDVVFCCGLLYHMDRPVEFLNLLGKVTRQMLILNTHYSKPDGHPEGIHQPGEWCGPPVKHEGRRGHWFHETDNRWASFGNKSSFWLEKPELLDAIRQAGFAEVTERTDWRERGGLPWGSGGPTADRGMFVAVK